MVRSQKDSLGRYDRILVIEDEQNRALDLSTFNLIPPGVGIFDAPYRCYRINNEWAKIVMGFVSWLASVAVWEHAENDTYIGIRQILEFLSQEGTCMSFDVRQNPAEPCLLEFSLDSGSTWAQFADITQCVNQTYIDNSIINALNNNTTIQNTIDQLSDGGADNDLPPAPTVSEPDLLCDAAYYIADKIIDFVDQTITDAATITLEEFLSSLLGLGGFDGSPLKLFWDLIIANSYPNLLSDVQGARSKIAESLYCNELDRDLTILDIDASLSIGEEAQAAIIGAINAVTDGKWALWAFVGSQVDSGETCAGFCSNEPDYTFDFVASNAWSIFVGNEGNRAVYSPGIGYEEIYESGRYRCSIWHDFGQNVIFERVEIDVYWEQAGNTNVLNLHRDSNIPLVDIGQLVEGKTITANGDQTLIYTTPFTTNNGIVTLNSAVGTQGQPGIQGEIIVKEIRLWLA